VELVVLVGLVILVAGFFVQGERGALMIGVGLVLGSLAGLELSIREHFAGFRSHSLLLAGFASVVVLAVLFYLAPDLLPPVGKLAIAAAVFALGVWGLSTAFRRRAGVAFKLR
jgi:hypothetical protein